MYTLLFSLIAALPPLYQSTRELQALLSDPRLSSSLGGAEPIVEIVRTENGYEVHTLNYRLEVDRIYLQQPTPGPARFQFEFHEPERLDANKGNN